MLIRSTQYKERIEKHKFQAYQAMRQSREKIGRIGQDFFGASYNVLIGHHGYPNLNVGFLSVDDKKDDYDNPKLWKARNYGIPDIIGLRGSLINSRFKTHIKSFDERLVDMGKEISMAKDPVDVEVNLKRKPFVSFHTGQEISPYGPSILLKKAAVTENPKIPLAVERLAHDEVKASEALVSLSRKGFDEHYLTRVFSMGNLGMPDNKKIVPTRWSITATDDTLGKHLISELRDRAELDHQAFYGGHMGNHYLILCFPGPWSYELFEIDLASEQFGTDYEGPLGRKGYATETVGGYYASRLAVLEKLAALKRQGSILVLRFITDEYWMSVGVWVVREATRTALASKPMVLEGQEQVLKYATLFARKQFGIDIEPILQKSKLLKHRKEQKRLGEFTS